MYTQQQQHNNDQGIFFFFCFETVKFELFLCVISVWIIYVILIFGKIIDKPTGVSKVNEICL